jgi:conjugal transfer/type IV secretion protein DotA/TraY
MMKYNKKTSILIIFLACCSIAMADGAANLISTDYSWIDTSDLLDVNLATDVSSALLSSIFGDFSGMLPTVTQGAGGLTSLLFGYFNQGLFLIAGMLVTYSVILSTMKTAEEGKAMGERTPIAWSLFRPVLGTSILIPVYNGYSVLQTFLMWATLVGIGLANSVWGTAISVFNTYGGLNGATSSISSNSSTSYSGAEALVQELFNSQFCFYSARQAYAKNKVSIDIAKGVTNTTEASYTGTTTCSSAIDPDAPCYDFNFTNSPYNGLAPYSFGYNNIPSNNVPSGYNCGSYVFSNTNSVYTAASSLDTSSDFWSNAETLVSGLVYTAFTSVNNIALDQFNNYYAIASDQSSTSDDLKKGYFTGDSGQCKSSTDCVLANSLAPIAILLQDSLDSALAVNPFTQVLGSSNNTIVDNGGWIIAASSYYQLVSNSANTTETLDVFLNKIFSPGSLSVITIPRYVLNEVTNSDFTNDTDSYAKVNNSLTTALANVITSLMPSSVMSDLSLGYEVNSDKFELNSGSVQYNGSGANLYKIIAAQINYAGASMFTDTNINDSYSNKITTIAETSKKGLDNSSSTTPESINLSNSGVKSIDLRANNMPNAGNLFFNGIGDAFSFIGNFSPFTVNKNYGDIMNLQINWFIAKILVTWQKYFLTANTQDPVTAVRGFGISVVENSSTFLIYMAIEAFMDNMNLLIQYLGYYVGFTVLSGIAHSMANTIFLAAKYTFPINLALFPFSFLAPIIYVLQTSIAYPFGGIIAPTLSGLAAVQIMLLQMSIAYNYLWLPILFGATVPLITLGLMLGIYAPMIPFLIFLLAAINWIIGVIEAMVAAPVVALGIAHPVGHDVLGRAELCLMLIFAVMIRPVAMVLGFIFAVLLCYVTFPLFNYIFLYFMQMFFANAILAIGGKGAAVSIFFALLLYCYVVLTFITQAFSMIYVVPNKIMRWIGVPVDRSDEEQWLEEVKGGVEDASGKLAKSSTETPGQMTSGSDALSGAQSGKSEFAGGQKMMGGKK